jgi:hydrogenase-4 component B
MDAFFLALLIYVVGAVFALVFCKRRELAGTITLLAHLAACLLMWSVVMAVFRQGPLSVQQPLWIIPGLHSELSFRLDRLSALFLAVISVMAVLTPLYGRDYMKRPLYPSASQANFYPVLSLFFASVSCVTAATDLFFFFIFWEMMTLASYVLVVFDKTDPVKMRAGLKYFVITHIATALMFIAALILFQQSGSFSFSGQREAMVSLLANRPGLLHLVLLFFFIGFATKAGILPMGDWLPGAYAAAPTPATAAFAGSMTKLGVYGILRIFIDLLPLSGHTRIWGAIIAVFGAASIFIGTMTALVQDDAKKLLSFHVIGQMGYMFLGIGMGIYFLASQPILALAGICAGIFHLINNVCYKSSLFFAAGSVYWKVRTFNINQVGGLSRVLPLTGLLTFLASLSIAGMPPFNGFASKWLIYQTAVKGGATVPLFIFLGIIALFISAVTLASFIKFSTAIFYGKFNDNQSNSQKSETPWGMLLSQIILVVLCVLLGVLPYWPMMIIAQAVSGLSAAALLPDISALLGNGPVQGLSIDWGAGISAVYSPVLLILAFVLCFGIVYGLYRATRPVRRVDETWYCGESQDEEEVRYQAHSYYLAFKQMFSIRMGDYQRPGIYPSIKYPKITFSDSDGIKKILDIDRWFYNPLATNVQKLATRFSATHSGIPHVYLLWLLIGTFGAVTLLFWLH